MKKLFEEPVNNPKPFTAKDKINQLMVNERFDLFAVFQNGRIFKKRAKGNSGSYDRWVELDIKGDIEEDLKL